MITTVFKHKTLKAALLGAAGIALCAQSVFAFGGMGGGMAGAMGGGIGGRTGGVGSARLGSVGMSAAAANVHGAVTIDGVTVLPNGSMLVPAVTPRTLNPGSSVILTVPPEDVAPCTAPSCAP